jgi:hypothetical protein
MSRLENAPSKLAIARMMAAMVDQFCASWTRPPKAITLDIDDTLDRVHGRQHRRRQNRPRSRFATEGGAFRDASGKLPARGRYPHVTPQLAALADRSGPSSPGVLGSSMGPPCSPAPEPAGAARRIPS